MNLLIALGAMLSLAPAAHGDAQGNCPVLPAGSGLEWAYQQGEDFGVCYGMDRASKKSLLGIYFGFAPSFEANAKKRIDQGTVGGRKVTWYRAPKEFNDSKLGREALVELNPGKGYVAHVWVNADTDKELQRGLSVFAAIKFRR
jgi:hypothetical protein